MQLPKQKRFCLRERGLESIIRRCVIDEKHTYNDRYMKHNF